MPDKNNPLWRTGEEKEQSGKKSSSANPLHPERVKVITPEVLPRMPPDYFDFRILQHDFEALATNPSLLAQYVRVARAKYRTAKQLELIDALIYAINKKITLTEAQTHLAEATEKQEDVIVLKERRRELKEAEQEAQLAELRLRKAR